MRHKRAIAAAAYIYLCRGCFLITFFSAATWVLERNRWNAASLSYRVSSLAPIVENQTSRICRKYFWFSGEALSQSSSSVNSSVPKPPER